MMQNAYFVAKIGADTAENEQHFAEILPTDGADGRLGVILEPAVPGPGTTSPGAARQLGAAGPSGLLRLPAG